VVIILNKNKSEEKKNKVLIIDAEKDFQEGKNQNILQPQDVNKIVKAFYGYEDIEKYARVVSMKDIEDKGFNLNIREYIDSSEEDEVIDVKKVRNEITSLKKELLEADALVEKYLDELNY